MIDLCLNDIKLYCSWFSFISHTNHHDAGIYTPRAAEMQRSLQAAPATATTRDWDLNLKWPKLLAPHGHRGQDHDGLFN